MPDKLFKVHSEKLLEVNEGKREVVSVISTDSIDRDGEVVLPRGMKKGNYNGNPVVMVSHDLRTLPVGKSLWIKAEEKRILAKSYISDKTQLARDAFGLLQDEVLNAWSVGFTTIRASAASKGELDARPDWAESRRLIREWELFEYSLVAVPANPEALTLAVSKGYSPETLDFLKGDKGTETQVVEQVIKEVNQKEHFSFNALIKALERAAEKRGSINIDTIVKAAFEKMATRR